MRVIQGVFSALLMAAASAWAALPDPVALGAAVEVGDIRAARNWLDQGMDPNMEADRIGTGLMIAAWEGNIPMMELFVARGADVNRANRFGEQALQLAAWRGQIYAVRWLLDHGAKARRQGKKWSAIHYAAYAGHLDVTRMLIENGADVNARAPNDASVLMMAALNGNEDLAALLLSEGADPRFANDRGDTALTWAMRYGNLRVARLVSSSEAFAKAAKAPPESFGPPIRSVAAPSEITDLLMRIKRAKAHKQPVAELRKKLAAAIEHFRQDAKPNRRKAGGAAQRPALVITARRQGGGERAEVVGGDLPAVVSPEAARQAQTTVGYDNARLAEFKRLLKELNQAQAEGRPTYQLRQAVRRAYARLKQR